MDPEKAARELREIFMRAYDASGLKRDAFAENLGVAGSYISNIKNHKAGVSRQLGRKLIARAKEYGLEADRIAFLLQVLHDVPSRERAVEAAEAPRERPSRSRGFLPVVGASACGPWIDAIDTGRDAAGEARWEYVGRKLAGKADAFLVEASGRSMVGSGIHNGDLLLVDPHAAIVSGCTVLVLMGGETTVKVWREVGDQIVLTPTNNDYAELVISKAEFAREGGRALRITGVQAFRDLPVIR